MTNNNFRTISNDRGDPLVDLNIPNIGNPNDSRTMHICLSFESKRPREKYQLLRQNCEKLNKSEKPFVLILKKGFKKYEIRVLNKYFFLPKTCCPGTRISLTRETRMCCSQSREHIFN